MIGTILSDFSRVILDVKDKYYADTLNGLHTELKDKYGEFDFFKYFEFDEKLLELYKKLKEKYSLNIFTTGTIQDAPEVKQRIDGLFENIYTVKDTGLQKSNPQAYLAIAQKLHKKPAEIVFIDDQNVNIAAAQDAGLNTILFTDFASCETALQKLGVNGNGR